MVMIPKPDRRQYVAPQLDDYPSAIRTAIRAGLVVGLATIAAALLVLFISTT